MLPQRWVLQRTGVRDPPLHSRYLGSDLPPATAWSRTTRRSLFLLGRMRAAAELRVQQLQILLSSVWDRAEPKQNLAPYPTRLACLH